MPQDGYIMSISQLIVIQRESYTKTANENEKLIKNKKMLHSQLGFALMTRHALFLLSYS